jgi:CheY-like chemotaxis protein
MDCDAKSKCLLSMPLETEFSLAGLRVFIVEDEFQILLLLEDMLADLGCHVVGTASTVTSALDKAQSCEADAAILDVNLAGQRVYPVAECLRRRGTPIIFSTGYGPAGIEPDWRSYTVLQKPYLPRQLAVALVASQAPTRRD